MFVKSIAPEVFHDDVKNINPGTSTFKGQSEFMFSWHVKIGMCVYSLKINPFFHYKIYGDKNVTGIHKSMSRVGLRKSCVSQGAPDINVAVDSFITL